jgi:hypothetical protein
MEKEKLAAVLAVFGLKPTTDIKDLVDAYEQLTLLDDVNGVIEEYKASLRQLLFDMAVKFGVTDEKGSYVIQFEDGTGFKKEARTKVKVNQDRAMTLVNNLDLRDTLKYVYQVGDSELIKTFVEDYRQNNSGLLPPGITEVATIDEGLLEQAFYDGRVKQEQLESIVDKETSYALKRLK